MCGRCPRWGWLLLVATANLFIWLGLAYLVAGLAGQDARPDVGAYLRQGRATVVTYLGERPAAVPQSGEAVAATDAGRPQAVPNPRLVVDDPEPASPAIRPALPSTEPQSGADLPAAGPEPVSPTAPAAESGGQGLAKRPAGAAQATTAAAAPTTRPMVLADPAFQVLMAGQSGLEQAGVGQAVRIHYSESTLNQEIAALLAGQPGLPYGNVLVDLHPDRIVVSGRVTVLGLDLKTELLGNLLAEGCEPRVEVQAVSVGGLLTPRFIKNQASSLVLQALDWYPPDAPLCLEQIVLEEGALTVYGYRR